MSTSGTRSTLDGMPKQFLAAMRTLFDIMDDKHVGYVKFSDIESRWNEDDANKGLPKGVIESLRKVTPPNGLLSFERFCAGLKICLLRNRSEFQSRKVPPTQQTQKPHQSPGQPSNGAYKAPPTVPRPQSVPADRLLRDHVGKSDKQLAQRQNSVSHIPSHVGAANARQHNPMVQHRALSMPQLGEKVLPPNSAHLQAQQARHIRTHSQEQLPNTRTGLIHIPREHPTTRSEILTALHNWKMGFQANRRDNGGRSKEAIFHTRGPGDGIAGVADARQNYQVPFKDFAPDNKAPAARKLGNRRREPRRHTVANGIDYSMLKRMKQLEQEKDILLQGLDAVDKARDWYLKQIGAVQEKMKYIGKNANFPEYSIDAHQEKLNFQMARIFEINQHLAALVDSSEKGFPMHMNLALHQPAWQARIFPQPSQEETTVHRLKQQNHMLTEEVSRKSERITQLEREKASLIQKIFQVQAHNRGVDDTTFM